MSPLSALDVSSAPTDLQIRFDCQSVEQFIDRYANDLSRGGIFVRTREPLSVGRMVRLDLQLRDGSPFIVGEGTVFWTREPDPTRAESEPGMGVRFNRLTVPSQKMLTYLLAEKAERERAESAINVDDDFENERTVVAPQIDLLAASWPEKQDFEFSPTTAAATPAPITAPEPTPQPPPPPALPEMALPLAAAEVTCAIELPRRRRKLGVGVGVAIGGLVVLAVMAALIPKLAAKPSPPVPRFRAAPGAMAMAGSKMAEGDRPAPSWTAPSAATSAPAPAASADSVASLTDGLDSPLREQDSCITGLGSLPR